ncbi:unnamed protein product [Chondrus crispus]|uniref:GB1/RHD3-type G domain-containing protein n=1 Tax=Chondrus crispus TaxID=2769 RepID=R7Q455_CHOCR|nr:unnamed protein product [Chondrus crispus]CDF33307.1 unnamed protein product [Chondrus crispus]|eukprot:XP_005713110.1 unnamed protein product [Chondrus crispus]
MGSDEEILQVIDDAGTYVPTDPAWFPSHAELGPEALSVVAVLGAQGSGKSSLLNNLFGTSFPVASRSPVTNATTKGIHASTADHSPLTVALDVEGSDSRDRGRDGRAFQTRCAGFVAAIADVILLNMWYHDVGRFDASGYALLDAVFAEAIKNGDQDPDSFKTALVFVVRDTDDDIDLSVLESSLLDDAKEIFQSSQSLSSSSISLDALFEIHVVALPHMRHCQEKFQEGCGLLAKRLTDSTDPDFLVKTAFSKTIPADGCGTFTKSLWESLYSTPRDTPRGAASMENADSSMVAAYKCNDAFSDALVGASERMSALTQGTLDDGEKIEGFGAKAAEVMNDALADYDAATEEWTSEPIQSRKRRELESIIDTSQHAIFMKQIQLLRENALAHFKSVTASDDMPSDFAFFTADSLFQREAEESKRPGSGWTTTQERTDLQNMMQEISTQRKRLMTVQVSAAQQQAHAMQYLQMQQSQMSAIQAQAYGGSAGQWNVGAAYRPPDTNINASLSYQQGRTNIQISMVPDESASLLGPNGFTAGVGPGNLGLSFNIGL